MSNGGYGCFAAFYDRLTTDVPYPQQADRLLELFNRFGNGKPQMLLDLACGSGTLTWELASRGLDMIGVDGSEDMLTLAREKACGQPQQPLFLLQDMRELDLYGTVDGCICTLDSLSHLCEAKDVAEVFRRLSLFIGPHGLLFFDVNTPYKHREILADNAFVFEEPDFLCTWRNRFLKKRCEVAMQLDFFVEQPDGAYERYTDTVRERAYSDRTLRSLLADAQFEVLATFDGYSDKAPTAETQRMLYVARSTRDFHV